MRFILHRECLKSSAIKRFLEACDFCLSILSSSFHTASKCPFCNKLSYEHLPVAKRLRAPWDFAQQIFTEHLYVVPGSVVDAGDTAEAKNTKFPAFTKLMVIGT